MGAAHGEAPSPVVDLGEVEERVDEGVTGPEESQSAPDRGRPPERPNRPAIGERTGEALLQVMEWHQRQILVAQSLHVRLLKGRQ
jgi:hypothetical protein